MKEDIKSIIPDGVDKTRLGKVEKIAIFLSGSNAILSRLMEDLIVVRMLNLGFKVESRTKIESIIAKEMMEQQKKESQQNILNIIKIAKIMNIDTVLTGVIIEAKQQYNFFDQETLSQGIEEKMVVTSVYLQLISVENEEVIYALTIDYQKGKSVSEAVFAIVNRLKMEIGTRSNSQ